MKFIRSKVDALSGDTEVRFVSGSFMVIASKRGVRFEGSSEPIFGEDDLKTFAALMGEAWMEHKKLKPNLMAVPSGH